MAEASRPEQVNLICAVLAGDESWFAEARDCVEKLFGPVDLESPLWPFDFTDYYAEEMGSPLLRRSFSFRELIAPDNLSAIKHTTNRLETLIAAAASIGLSIRPSHGKSTPAARGISATL